MTENNIEELRSLDMPLVVAYIDEDDSLSSKVFESIADLHHDKFLFGISSDVRLAKAATLKPPFLLLRSTLDHIDRVFSEKFDNDEIEQFLSSITPPLIGKFSLETYYEYTQVRSIRIQRPENSAG